MLSMLAELRESDKVQYGAKATALGELIRSGEKVPIGFALSLENKKRIKSIILSQLGEEDSQEFLSKLELAEKAYLARDNHHYYFERMTRSYLRLAITDAEEVLLRNKQIQHKGDMYFLTVNELKEGLIQGSDYNKLINERKELFNYQKKLLAPPIIGKASVKKADCRNQNDEHGIGKLRE